jgi:hypothetical protein
MEKVLLSEEIKDKWAPILEAEGVEAITDRTVRNNTIRVLENTMNAINEDNTTGSVGGIASVSNNNVSGAGMDPILISMVRRAMPVLVANDIMGVQPMDRPTGLVFAMNCNRYVEQGGTPEAIWGTEGYVLPANGKVSTAAGEALGKGEEVNAGGAGQEPVTQTSPWKEVGFDISKTSVTAQTRALKARYSDELAQDLRAVHGLDAEAELAALLSQEIVAEQNREMVNLVNSKAIVGAQQTGLASVGTFDLASDTDARWQIEAYKSLYFQIEREANLIGKQTGRGRGNILIVSPDVASALEASQKLDLAPLGGNVVGGWTGISFAGILNGKYKVFIDPYAATDYITVGYKGVAYDAGLFYCPYVPMQFMKARGEDDFQPRIGFKSRYGLVANPFAGGATSSETGTDGQNQYYRTFAITNLAVTQ